MKTTSTLMRSAVALGLVAALAVPATAFAIPGRGGAGTGSGGGPNASAGAGQGMAGTKARAGAKASNEASRQAFRDQRQALLEQRVAMVLKFRQERFDANATRLANHITRVTGFADRIETAGGDVSSVRTKLAQATSLLEQAKSEEAKAVELFKAVPTATDKKAAFAAARAQAKTAGQTLKSSREALRSAILSLRAIANGLKGAEQ